MSGHFPDLRYVTEPKERIRYFNEVLGGAKTFCSRPIDDLLMLADPKTGCFRRAVSSEAPLLLHNQTEICGKCGLPIARTWGGLEEVLDE